MEGNRGCRIRYARPAVVASAGVSMYLTKDAIAATLRQIAGLARGSTLVMTFLLPLELADATVRPGLQRALEGARASGTPFISFFAPTEMLTLARTTGFREVHMCRQRLLASATSRTGQTAFARQIMLKNYW